jgi:ABC-type branched-subunit amino acid transport system substrate-binding protein
MLGKLKFASALQLALSASAFAGNGVTATEIKIGGVRGLDTSTGLVGKGVLAYVQSIDDQGGINGRKINYIAYDDMNGPPKAVEHVPELVERDEVAFISSQFGTPDNSAAAKYLTLKWASSIALTGGSSKYPNVANFPRATARLVSLDTGGKIYAATGKRSE